MKPGELVEFVQTNGKGRFQEKDLGRPLVGTSRETQTKSLPFEDILRTPPSLGPQEGGAQILKRSDAVPYLVYPRIQNRFGSARNAGNKDPSN